MEIVDNDLDVRSRSQILARGNNKPWIFSNR